MDRLTIVNGLSRLLGLDKTISKIKNKKGESLAETLVAVLISAMGLVLLLSLLMAGTRIIEKGQAQMSSTYAAMGSMEVKALTPTSITAADGIKISWDATNSVDIAVNMYKDEESTLTAYSKH